MKISTYLWALFTLFLLVKPIYLQYYKIPDIEVPEIALFTTVEIIQKYGFPVEVHTVITDDGYILTLHRIPYSPKLGASVGKSAVLYQHGFTSNSAETLIPGPENSLALFLSDSGYDVWLGNARGNRYTRRHVSLNPNTFKFWDFSWAEMGYYDMPAIIDYILLTTRQEKMFYIGHSRGTTVSYVMCSERPEYNNKFKAIISLAPVAYLSHISSPPFLFIARNLEIIQKLASSLGIYRIGPGPRQLARVAQVFCKTMSLTFSFCQNLLLTTGGTDYDYFNSSLIAVTLAHIPDAISTKELFHFEQLIISGKFRHYDYGYTKNLKLYNSSTPTDYNLTKVTAPVHLFYSNADALSDVVDVDQLYQELGNPIEKILLPGINHFAYTLGKRNVREIFFEKLLDIMQRY